MYATGVVGMVLFARPDAGAFHSNWHETECALLLIA